ncbi:hypothetical protein Rahaq_0009 [Rahnella aceris]|uniref:Uncharacterized protein n=1 Tax=Rahnella sp. (strain Y9602) TaxID=2703885 RepID=A0A0H3F4G4_RAHSY|nr:hypothetical protein Rahaq_0009 [Rahnella aceris]CAH0175486.1 hypothetical protein SRABI106_00980 [Rahnella aquatilis]
MSSSFLDVTVQLPDGEPKLFHFVAVNNDDGR